MKQENNSNINLSYEELNILLEKEIGHGTDGKVIKYDKNRLIKLYHKYIQYYKKNNHTLTDNDDKDLKIYCKGDYKKNYDYFDMFRFYTKEENDEFIRICNGETAIESAKERQFNVKNTFLPKGSVYVDGKFAGCVLTPIKGIQIHKLNGLPFNLKRKIMKKVLLNVKELISNCIYHIDLNNSPFAKDNYFINNQGKRELVGHSHVIINPFTLNPQLIDLDGKSTIYTDSYSKKLEHKCLGSFNRLMMEFMIGIDLDDYKDEEELSLVLEQIGINNKYIDILLNDLITYDEIYEFIDSVDKIKKI